MSKVKVSRNVPFTPDQVFAVASDVASYREFLPLMKESTVYSRKFIDDTTERFESQMTVSYKKLGISETIHSVVTVNAAKREVRAVSGEEGPMRSLDATWHIVPAPGGGSIIELDIDYALKSRSLQFLLSGMFDMMMRKIMSAFEDRARKLYGKSA